MAHMLQALSLSDKMTPWENIILNLRINLGKYDICLFSEGLSMTCVQIFL